MADKDHKGIDAKEGCSDWFLVEAECSDTSDLENDLENLFNEGADSDISDLIDDGDIEQGNSRELLCQQEAEESEQQTQLLKRKYLSPKEKEILQLSPQLESISLSPHHKSKKRLFVEQDSGLELSLNEVEDLSEEVEVPAITPAPAAQGGEGEGNLHYKALLKCSNAKATLLSKFKDAYGVSFNELTRHYQSNKTCCRDWVVSIYAVKDDLLEGSKHLLQKHCSYIWMHVLQPMSLFLLCFNAGKSRETVFRLLSSILQVNEIQTLSEPPKWRSVLAALYWYKGSMNPNIYTFGTYPDWIVTQTMISHQSLEATQFSLSDMIQWAFDNDYIEDADIAYNYAKLSDTNSNAKAFLDSNSQAKYVRECALMVKHYKRGQMREMSISSWIHTRLLSVEGEGHWSHIVKFIRYQNLNFIVFLDKFKTFLQNTPKRNCILFHGPPDSGKSMFTMSLIRVLKGKVLSFANSRSHFWLQPLSDAKIALLDDATYECWNYFDTFLRNGIDGNPVSLDIKHKAPLQIQFPPLMITSNIDINKEDRYRYLQSRIMSFEFPNKFPFDSNNKPQFLLTDQSWKSFFERLWTQLELSDPEDEADNGGTQRSFQCTTRDVNGHL